MVTMLDVAQRAGVSASTVSHVINKTRPVLPETEKAVLDAIAAMGYSSDGIARSLRTGTTKTIGLAMSAISNPYFGDVVQAIETELTAAGYSLLLADTHDTAEGELSAVRNLLMRKTDAIIMAPYQLPETIMRQLVERKIPTVLIDRLSHVPQWAMFDAVGVENVHSTAFLVGHLAGIGHRRIGFVPSGRGIATTTERLEGYRLGLAESKLPFAPELVGDWPGEDEPAAKAIDSFLVLDEPPTAIVAGNNMMTIGVMRALKNHGLWVPDDIALASYDDFSWADLFSPRLTTMAQPVKEMAHIAVTMLLDRMADPTLSARHVMLEPTFVHRDSCGCNLHATGAGNAPTASAR
jgi:LacI family transcriptional regulator